MHSHHQKTPRRMIGTIIIRIVYGLDTSGSGMEYVHIAEDAMDAFNAAFEPGRYLVQTFPWLRFVPSWFPGAGFQRDFAEWRPRVQSMRDVPWEAAVARKVSPCLSYVVITFDSFAQVTRLTSRKRAMSLPQRFLLPSLSVLRTTRIVSSRPSAQLPPHILVRL